MPDYFLSDVHLRHDRPDRGARLARLVDRLGPGDPIVVVGDLADFWLASRGRHLDPMSCEGLRSLARFRDRGGRLTILAGNHDGLLGDYYRKALGADWVDDSLRLESHGVRLHLAHGHRLGARSPWKAAMEGPAFLHAFGMVPGRIARSLERRLESNNRRHRDAVDPIHLDRLRAAADRLRGDVDAVIVGHIHMTKDDIEGNPRLIVLGSWHARASYLRIDESGASLVLVRDGDPAETIVGPDSVRTDG